MCNGAGFGIDCFRRRPGYVMALGLIVTNHFRGRPGCVVALGFIVTVYGGGRDVSWSWV